MLTSGDAPEVLRRGIAQIREQFEVPNAFPPDVLAEADDVARRALPTDRPDRTDLEMVTLDPASATDLDQAFALEQDGDEIILQYAIADVAWFVEPDSALDREAWLRGTTVYLPDARVGVYPPAVSEAAASLLPDGPRPAVLLSVAVDGDGEATLRRAEQVLVRSRAKLGYETATAAQLSPLLNEFARRVVAAELRRGASRVEYPEQEVGTDPARPGCYELSIRPRRASEDLNATMSLAANLALASAMAAAGTGLFRVMDDPDEREVRSLRYTARRFGLSWPAEMSLDQFQRSLATDDPRAAAFLLSARRASGGASYAPFEADSTPWHSAVAATYAHATAPLRRLADRYVLRAVCALSAGDPVPSDVAAAFVALPEAMEQAEARASKVDKAVLDLVEAVVLSSRIGEVFDATVLDVDQRGARIQLDHPAVVARVDARRVEPGDEIRVKLEAADPEQRRVTFTRVG
jgi:VacB/RNase II family 3'-5' exoribonuclease